MQILSVTLKNFKAHHDRHFQFEPGTNAICGENGAGKTSILEAIAWTLFNYKGAYRREDLIRNGSGSAQTTVAFISSQDGRTYEVQRCTNKGYILYDPQLNQRLPYIRIEEEVMPWLRQHMGVAPGTDLGRLFANTIGVPQGTFTADFLQPAEKRKPIFDAILKVEEYRQAYQQLLSLEKYAKAEVEGVQRAIAQYEETLKDWEVLKPKQQELRQDIEQNQARLKQLHAELAQLQHQKDELAAQAQQVQQLQIQLQTLTTQIEGKSQANRRLEQALKQAQQAANTCTQHKSDYEAFLQAESTLQALDKRYQQKQTLLKQQAGYQATLDAEKNTLTRLMLQLEHFAQAEATIQQLQPLVQKQLALTEQQAAIGQQLQALQHIKLEQHTIEQQHIKLKRTRISLKEEIERLQALEVHVKQIPNLEKQRHRYQEQLSRVEAAKQFEAELQHLVKRTQAQGDRYQTEAESALKTLQQLQQSMPLLAAAPVDLVRATIQSGVSLNDDLRSALQQILADLATQVSVSQLQQKLQTVKCQLEQNYQQQTAFATLTAKITQQAQLDDEFAQLQTRLSHLQSQLSAELGCQQQQAQLAAAIQTLNDPRGQCQLLQRQLQQRPQIKTQYETLHQRQAQVQQRLADLAAQLEPFAGFETQLEHQKHLRQTHQPGYQTYLQNQRDANQLSSLEAEFATAIAQLKAQQTEQVTRQIQYHQLAQAYDPKALTHLENTYSQTKTQADQIAGSLPQQHQRLEDLERQLGILQTVAQKRDRAQAELKQRERIKRFISFARKAYKQAGPRITERYVQSVARTADQLFRELLNRQNVALDWTQDYEIQVQEGPHSRRFINLSGGEQMCAALAVRLALLKVLADIDIAFFDEPTTNMDRARRDSLAEAIANIKTFRQLFVISHDDTFEKVTENVILVERN
ncbi:MAG: SMC family ATPase [Cyanothece sp. SIO1E1]|nr:SMC family ATPase [Cyanothece sp. SIO1E1]